MEKVIELFASVLGKLLDRFWAKRTLRNAQAIADIYNNLKRTITYHEEVYRFVVWIAEDSGANIRPGVQLYISCLYEDFKSPVTFAKKYQRVMTDGDYVNLLVACMSKGRHQVHTKSQPSGSVFYLINDQEEIRYTEFHHLHSKGNAIYYCTVCSVDQDQEFQHSDCRMDIDLAVNDIRRLIKKSV